MGRILLLAVLLISMAPAADWPEWRGEGRRGVWAEDGILEKFPESGLAVSWRRPCRRNFAAAGTT